MPRTRRGLIVNGDAAVRSSRLHALEMRAAIPRRGSRAASARAFTISCIAGFLVSRMRSGLRVQAALRIGVEQRRGAFEIGDQVGAVARALVGIADAS